MFNTIGNPQAQMMGFNQLNAGFAAPGLNPAMMPMDGVSFSPDAQNVMMCQQPFGPNMGLEGIAMGFTTRLLAFVRAILELVARNGYGALGNMFGGNNGAAPAQGGAGVNPGVIGGGTAFGQSLAKDAFANANGPGGWCFRWVSQALGRHGVRCSGASAYMGADQLARNDKFREVHGLSRNQLKSLPAGAVVVWDRAPSHPHGHISIADGHGREACDRIRPQMTNFPSNFRVFLPK